METVSQDPAYGGDRLQFFNVQEPFSLPVSEFEVRWRDVDNVWVQFGTTKTLKKNPDGWTIAGSRSDMLLVPRSPISLPISDEKRAKDILPSAMHRLPSCLRMGS